MSHGVKAFDIEAAGVKTEDDSDSVVLAVFGKAYDDDDDDEDADDND